MARAAKVCSQPHCAELQPCAEHQRKPWEGSTRRSRLRTRSGSRQQKLRLYVLDRDDHTCHVCGQWYLPHLLVNDHVIPVTEGGADATDNMAACCLDCHATKTQEEATRARNR